MHRITVIGSGTMGNGIAHSFAQHGYQVSLMDIDKNSLDRALQAIEKNLTRQVNKQILSEDEKTLALQNITTFTSLELAVKDADLAIEAVSENTDIKLGIFRELDNLCPADTILATNTSSIPITQIAANTSRPEKVVGMHFMNPVPVMKLVEVIRGYDTDEHVTESIVSIAKSLSKTPVIVNDYPGFVANRILMPMINEAIYSLYEGVAGVEEIDTVMKLGMAHPMGPLQLADFIGLDICLAILKVLHDGLGNPKYAPCPLLVNMVHAKHLGVKSGMGFYQYPAKSKDIQVAKQFSRKLV
ncbi:3-hydroxybutyryl-CoA dehydrogenase [Olivibacter sp. SDN3]|uniref:3-hydroxyacyl-CoA dehydrogenase family protein n=1 Tax=Olivibacter sp. SDN3 TaxID=2764720 RepID=UPI00165173BC|nr:3-hydroxybutyryl-CoA dehydrogenase [Olivibacter sp. SDN3]QNL48919.1 3-hydroxybutyryl-CoA dehydrogenase [Olivibacter sp. SDN3]